ncbi:MAG: sodium:solute symporter [Candidatus Omnitrophica bacterium]|nr:sodium:solute symporter [Candidatus Omnitrophota bacterium]
MATDYLNHFDYLIIGLYLFLLLGLGFWLKKKASESLEDYIVGGRNLPWWVLGVSGMASFLDVAGTMVIVSFLYMLGPRGLFIEFRGGAVLVLVIMMLWTGKWHRRSGCLTGAEWMIFRFGDGPGGRFAQLVKAISAIIMTIGMLAYLIVGVGLFLSMFLPFTPPQCAFMLVFVASIYTMFSGFYGVVLTDFIQSAIIIIAVIIITALAVNRIEDGTSLAAVAERVTGNSQWLEAAPHWHTYMPVGYEAYESLILFASIYLMRNIFFGMGTGDDPKYFGAKNDAECAKLSFLWTCLISVRWPMMMGVAVLGIYLVGSLFPEQSTIVSAADTIKANVQNVTEENWQAVTSGIIYNAAAYPKELITSLSQILGEDWKQKLLLVSYNGSINPERIMPAVLLFDIPTGLRGLLLIALLAASMSTFDTTVNTTAGMFVRDIYQKHLRPHARMREMLIATWIFIAAIVGIGFLFAYSIKSINDIWDWIIMGLGGGMMLPLILRLYWWRFNGGGFAIGMTAGLIAALAQRALWPDLTSNWQLLTIGSVGLVGSVAGALLTPPTSDEVLEEFYCKTRPFGFWGPLKKRLEPGIRDAISAEHRRDLTAVPFALTFQIMIFLAPMLMVIQNWTAALVCVAIALVALLGLYVTWLRYIQEPDRLNEICQTLSLD